jgi:RNA-directed DNA polymerase
VLSLVKAFLKSDILGEDRQLRESSTGAPQGSILSPLLSNIALSVLDEHFAKAWAATGDSHDRQQRRRKGLANYRLVRYADDFLILVAGDRADAERLREETARVLIPMGLRLSEEKTVIVHIDEGFDFLGMHIQRHKKLGAAKRFVYTYPSRAALASVKAKVRGATRGTTNQSLSELVSRLNPVLRGWTNYHRHGASSKTFSYLSAFTWRRVWIWLRHKHPKATVKELRHRYLPGWWPTQDKAQLFKPGTVAIVRYRYRGTAIPSPWATSQTVA